MREFSSAVDRFTRAIQINPNDASAFSLRSLTHFQAGNFENALLDSDRVIELEPEIAGHYRMKGEILIALQNPEALECFDKVLQLQPDNAEAIERRESLLNIVLTERLTPPLKELAKQIDELFKPFNEDRQQLDESRTNNLKTMWQIEKKAASLIEDISDADLPLDPWMLYSYIQAVVGGCDSVRYYLAERSKSLLDISQKSFRTAEMIAEELEDLDILRKINWRRGALMLALYKGWSVRDFLDLALQSYRWLEAHPQWTTPDEKEMLRERLSQVEAALSQPQSYSAKSSRNSIPPMQNVQQVSRSETVAVSHTQPTYVSKIQPTQARSPFILPSLILGSLISAFILASMFLARINSPVVDQPSISAHTPEPTPSTQPSSSSMPQASSQIRSKLSSPKIVTSLSNSIEPNRLTSRPLSQEIFLRSPSGERVDIYAQPSVSSTSPHYGLNGDRVTALEQIQSKNGDTWYFVRFPSGADGWVRSDFVKLGNSSDRASKQSVQFPHSAQLVGQSSGSKVNVRSAPSTRSNSPHYGLVGDRVTALQQSQGDDGQTWYYVRFSSGATGWVRGDFVELQ
jgi:tetratricopeptide (TPR) repeat protein